MLFNTKIKELTVIVEMCFQRLSGVIGYIDSEYDSVNNITINSLMFLRYKTSKINYFVKMWFQRLSGVIDVHRFRIFDSTCPQI